MTAPDDRSIGPDGRDATAAAGVLGGVLGVVLAGGASLRLGSDKARLPWAGTTLAGWAAARLATVVEDVVLADGGRRVLAGYLSLPDARGDGAVGPGERKGPAAGILGAAAAYRARSLLVLACDLPQVPATLLAQLLAQALATGADLVMPKSERGLEPLCAFYGRAALARLSALGPEAGPHRLVRARGLEVLVLDLDDRPTLDAAGLPHDCFANLNTPEDAARLGLPGPSPWPT